MRRSESLREKIGCEDSSGVGERGRVRPREDGDGPGKEGSPIRRPRLAMLSWRALSAASTSGGKDDRYSAGGAAAGEADVAEALAITGKVERPMYALRGCSGVG